MGRHWVRCVVVTRHAAAAGTQLAVSGHRESNRRDARLLPPPETAEAPVLIKLGHAEN